jgi:hypothetical protein
MAGHAAADLGVKVGAYKENKGKIDGYMEKLRIPGRSLASPPRTKTNTSLRFGSHKGIVSHLLSQTSTCHDKDRD